MTGRNRRGRPEVVRPGLERIRAAFEMSGHPERSFRTFHIAGTNGKGSTAAFLEAILRRLVSEPVGLYTSPHLVSAEERIRVDGAKIPGEDLRRALRRAAGFSRGMGPDNGDRLSYFEEMTWAACDWFRKKSARIVVMEAGLGGRWDATSACEPAVSIVTTVGKDHQEWLGDSLREIAGEKAEIFRRGVPAILGKLRGVPRSVATAKAKERGSPIWELGHEFSWEVSSGGRIRVRGVSAGQRGDRMRGRMAVGVGHGNGAGRFFESGMRSAGWCEMARAFFHPSGETQFGSLG
ncbi:MAG: Dihydrofolate synthase [Actinobacteria bacterium]|nr:Dihydrofolate synthase [Actinomycetota bacterium]